ncbi:MAG: MraY family glycosyltransferase [Pseudomonadota bacterium]
MYTIPVLLVAFVTSVFSILAIKPLAISIGLVDQPGGRKAHDQQTPLIGGIAIFFSVALAWYIAPRLGLSTINSVFAAASGLIFIVGLIDDRKPLSVWLRFGVQGIAVGLMIYGSVVVRDVGFLFGEKPLQLHLLSIPITVFATIGAINAMNMIDGVDGLAGSVSLVSFGLLLLVAFNAGHLLQILILLCVLGGLIGFLFFNMPIPGRDRAHVFMGDAGSTLIGFLLAHSLIVLSQGDNRGMAPVTTLWIFAVPLMDTLGVMIRRLWLRRSPFAADRNHIHHLFLDADFRIRHAVLAIVLLQASLGGVGLALDKTGAPELLSLALFGIVFCGYVYLISRPWRIVPRLRQVHGKLGMVKRGVEYVYVGGLNHDSAVADIEALLDVRVKSMDFEVYRQGEGSDAHVFALISAGHNDRVEYSLRVLRLLLRRQQRLGTSGLSGVEVIRQFVPRNPGTDRRSVRREVRLEKRGASPRTTTGLEKRQGDRRQGTPRLIYRSSEQGRGQSLSNDGLQLA